MADLRTTYMGFELKNPLLPSASPLSRNLEDIKALEDAGAPGVVLYSLFEEQVALESGELSHLLQKGAASLADASAYFPQTNEYPRDPDHYVEHVRQAKEAVDIPIIAERALMECNPTYPVPKIMSKADCMAVIRQLKA